jgi:hypothetical protein
MGAALILDLLPSGQQPVGRINFVLSSFIKNSGRKDHNRPPSLIPYRKKKIMLYPLQRFK